MAWNYNFLSGIARHSETGKEFRVERSMPEDRVTVSTVDGQPHDLEPSSLEALENHCVSEKNRHELQRLIQTLFQNDFSRAVVTLNKADGRKASVRTLQAWLMPPDRQSSRRCPTWAVIYLENYRDTHAEDIRIYREFKDSQVGLRSPTRVDRVYNGSALQDVERQLAFEERYRRELRTSSISALPDLLADKLLKIESNYERLLSSHFALLQSVRSAESLEDLKVKLNAEEDDLSRSNQFVATAREALLSNSEEFASDDGTLPEDASFTKCVFPGSG
ncbi:hypothetical protein ACIGCM_09340 [Pseudomonas sp. NPDC078700]|uniref:hypothetical protein n=1 Tax=Pseudomonas sp. NPDC078700 TaxID=3364424 RepID=UPI0037CB885D